MTRNRRAQTSGQTLPLLALAMPAMLALMALGLDGAQIFLEKRDAQSAADLAALGGVRSLPDAPDTAKSDAKAIGVAHGYAQADVVPVTPYNSDSDQIEVTVHSRVNTFFMPIFNVITGGDHSVVDVTARAVAKADWTAGTEGGGGFAVFAMEEGCSTLEKSVDISGSDDFFIGRVHSNSDIHVGGSNNSFTGDTTSVCGLYDGGGGNTFDPAPTSGSTEPDPIAMDYADFCPPADLGYIGPGGSGDWDLASDGPWWVGGTKDSKTLNPGVYCASDKIKLSDSDIVIADVDGSSGITFVGQYVEISGSNFTLTAYQDNILFAAYADSDVAMKVSGSGGDWGGLIYAPNGTAELSGQLNGGDRLELTGGVIGERVKLNGSDAYIDGTIGASPASPPEQTISLIE